MQVWNNQNMTFLIDEVIVYFCKIADSQPYE